MHLEACEIEFANRSREFIMRTTNTELLLRCKCRRCNGTGLKNYYRINNEAGSFWDGQYCDYCKGVGFVNPKEIDVSLYSCCVCGGEGIVPDILDSKKHECSRCKGAGFVNWVENLFGKKAE
jgi:DnaJ-class molecular chaperone